MVGDSQSNSRSRPARDQHRRRQDRPGHRRITPQRALLPALPVVAVPAVPRCWAPDRWARGHPSEASGCPPIRWRRPRARRRLRWGWPMSQSRLHPKVRKRHLGHAPFDQPRQPIRSQWRSMLCRSVPRRSGPWSLAPRPRREDPIAVEERARKCCPTVRSPGGRSPVGRSPVGRSPVDRCPTGRWPIQLRPAHL